LAEGIEVKGAWLDNGLLHIDLAKLSLGSCEDYSNHAKHGVNSSAPEWGRPGTRWWTARRSDETAGLRPADRQTTAALKRLPYGRVRHHEYEFGDRPRATAEEAGVFDVRHLSEQQLAALGVSHIAYVKRVSVNGVPGFAISRRRRDADGCCR